VKTNAARLLERLGITFELRDYEVDPEQLDAVTVAHKVGLAPAQVFKTLVARGDRTGVLFAVVPADRELDLKALARLTGDRKVDTVALKELTPLTGYVRGGCTALAAKKDYPVFVHESALTHERIAVSAGVRGTQMVLAPADYLRATRATSGAIAK
jgi:Cys-tRNA(Pro)/Cys-tRNA(Cys) deacylase